MEPILKFSISNQKIFRTDDLHVVAKSKSYLHAEFSFLSDDWEGLTKTAIFDSGKPYTAVLKDNACLVPWEALAEPGLMMVSAFGGDLITTDKASVRVHESGYKEGETPEPPTPSAYEQFVSLVEEIGDKASKSAGQAEQSAASASDSSNQAVAAAEAAVQSSEKASKSAQSASESETNAKSSEMATQKAASEIVAEREQIKTNKSDIANVKNTTESPVPEGRVWTATKTGARWQEPQTVGTVTEQDVANWGFTKNTGTYSKPEGGIPESDLEESFVSRVSALEAALVGVSDLIGGEE